MPGKPVVSKIKKYALSRITRTEQRYLSEVFNKNYLFVRWVATMTAVELYAIWERYTEKRLIAALSYYPQHFVLSNDIRGLKHIPIGLGAVLAKGNRKYFDCRSTSELIDIADRLVGRPYNPFVSLRGIISNYLDTLSAIRNYTVHDSESALHSYKQHLTHTYNVKSKPNPDEFLNAKDIRKNSPARYKQRILGLIKIVKEAVTCT